jgi:catechol 2,3-dioxygenase-like lactoylglutathione lyase family enzyme
MITTTKSRLLVAAFAALAMAAWPRLAAADAIPGLRGHDHTGITVPDVKAATAFFTDVIGCSHAMSFGPFSDDKGTFMQDVVNVHPRAVIDEISMVRCGYGSNIELFQYQAPDQAKTLPRNSDIGGTISRCMSMISKRRQPISRPRTSGRCRGRSRSPRVPRPGSRSCISSRHGACRWS